MIISASYRTDIPAFHAAWFQKAWRAGFVSVRNPYGGDVRQVDLIPAGVDGFVFWTRNPAPFLDNLDEIAHVHIPFYLTVTVTQYPRFLERSVPGLRQILPVLRELVRRWGRRVLVWRYDPILLAGDMDAAWHRGNFAALAADMAALTDAVVFSWMQPYAKTRRNLDKAGLDWRDPGNEEKRALLVDLAAIARDQGLRPSLCSQPDLQGPALDAARCIDADRLSDLAGRAIAARIKGNRPGCLCAQAVDIGAYDTCAHGCVYCYAVRNPEAGKRGAAAGLPI